MSAVARKEEFHPSLVELVPMKRRHVRQVMKIESQVYPRPWSAALFLQEISRRTDRVYLAARYGDEIIGYGGMMTSGLEAHVTTIAVDPVYHRHRLGTKIMIGLVDGARERGAHSISLEVRKSNLGAQKMYDKFGFKPVGIRKGYYIETGEDAIVMLAEGIDTPEYDATLDGLRLAIKPGFGGRFK